MDLLTHTTEVTCAWETHTLAAVQLGVPVSYPSMMAQQTEPHKGLCQCRQRGQ